MAKAGFSRRHQTSEAHLAERRRTQDAREKQLANVADRQKARDARTNAQQLAALDRRLGKGIGARDERRRLGN